MFIAAASPRILSLSFTHVLGGKCILVNRRVMVVDNEPSVCEFLSDMLFDEGYEPVIWTRGAGAYAEAKRIHPAAMLLDMNMETPNAGLIVAEAMCGDRETQDIPIIIVSAEHDFLHEKYAWLHQLPCQVHPKPVDIPALLSLLNALIEAPTRHP